MKKISALILTILVVFSLFTGCSRKQQNNDTVAVTTKQESTQEKWTAVLFFSDKNAVQIIKENRDILSNPKLNKSEKAKISIEELIKGSSNKELMTTISAKTKVNSVVMDKDTAVIDLSKDFVVDNVGGSAGETMAIAPIILTLTEIDGIKQVQFKIDGKIQSDFKGHFTLDRPFKRSDFEQYLTK